MTKQFSRRSFLKLAAAGSAGLALAACQPNAAQQPTPATGDQPGTGADVPAAQKQTVTFTMYGHPNMIEEMVPLFNQSQDQVEVQFERSEGQGYWEKLTAAVAAGTAWDCYRGDPNRALSWGPRGVAVDVRQYMEQDQQYPINDYIEGALDVYSVEGKIYGVPTWCLTMWMFYNKNMFDEAGLNYPSPATTWTEYLEMAKTLTKRDGDRVTQFGANGWSGWTFPVAQIVWSNGGKFYYSDDMTRIAVDDPNTVQAMQELADLHLVHRVAPDPTVPQSSPVGILSDNVATQGDGDYLPWDNREVYTEKYDYLDATLPPSFNGNRTNIYWPDCFMVNARSQNPEAAYKWMAWFAQDPAATEIQCKVVFPTYTRAYTDDSIASRWLVAPRPPGMIEQARQHVENARMWKVELHINDIDNIYYNEVGRLWSGEANAEAVMAEIARLGNEEMAKPVPTS
jgi:multiple sugar transport system substrate-binding protein